MPPFISLSWSKSLNQNQRKSREWTTPVFRTSLFWMNLRLIPRLVQLYYPQTPIPFTINLNFINQSIKS